MTTGLSGSSCSRPCGATIDMIVYNADRLHVRIRSGRSDEREATLLQGLGESDGFGRERGNVGDVANRRSPSLGGV